MPGKSGNDQKAFYRYDLFISYASEDFEQARKLVTRLQQDGYRVWFDKTEMPGTGQVSGNLGQAVDDSRQFIICLSDTYCRKDYTQYELQIIFSKDPANSRNTRIVTQIAASLPEKIPDSISFVPRLDLSRQENYEQEYQRLKNGIDTPAKTPANLPSPVEIKALRRSPEPYKALVEIKKHANTLASYIYVKNYNQTAPAKITDIVEELNKITDLDPAVIVNIKTVLMYWKLIESSALDHNNLETPIQALLQLSEWTYDTYNLNAPSADPFASFWAEAAQKLPTPEMPLKVELQQQTATLCSMVYPAYDNDRRSKWDLFVIPVFTSRQKELSKEIAYCQSLEAKSPLLFDSFMLLESEAQGRWQLCSCNRPESVSLQALAERFKPLPQTLAMTLYNRILSTFFLLAQQAPILCISMFHGSNLHIDRSGTVRTIQHWTKSEEESSVAPSVPTLESFWFNRDQPSSTTQSMVDNARSHLVAYLKNLLQITAEENPAAVAQSLDDDGLLHTAVQCFFDNQDLPVWLTSPQKEDELPAETAVSMPQEPAPLPSQTALEEGIEEVTTQSPSEEVVQAEDMAVEVAVQAENVEAGAVQPENVTAEEADRVIAEVMLEEIPVECRSAWLLGNSTLLVWDHEDKLAIYSLVDGKKTWQEEAPFHLRVAAINAQGGVGLGSWEGEFKWFMAGELAGYRKFGAPIGDIAADGDHWLVGAWNEKFAEISSASGIVRQMEVTGGVQRIITGMKKNFALLTLQGCIWSYHHSGHFATDPIPAIIDLAFSGNALYVLVPSGLIKVGRNGSLPKPDMTPSRTGLSIQSDPDTEIALLVNKNGQSWQIIPSGTFPAGPALPPLTSIKRAACSYTRVLSSSTAGGYEYYINKTLTRRWKEALFAELFAADHSVVVTLPNKVIIFKDSK